METRPIDSSNIYHAGWQADMLVDGYEQPQDVLRLVFASGRSYDYFGVAREIYDAFLSAESKGAFFHKNIKGRYKEARVN